MDQGVQTAPAITGSRPPTTPFTTRGIATTTTRRILTEIVTARGISTFTANVLRLASATPTVPKIPPAA